MWGMFSMVGRPHLFFPLYRFVCCYVKWLDIGAGIEFPADLSSADLVDTQFVSFCTTFSKHCQIQIVISEQKLNSAAIETK